jgi:hypothetical protein
MSIGKLTKCETMPLLDPFETEVTPTTVIELFNNHVFTAIMRKE